MKKITFLFLFVLAMTFGYAQNLITNGTFDDATGWTPLIIHDAAFNIGDVTIANGVATFTEVDDPEWTHLGIGTSVYLEPGIYQFDMDVSFNNPVDSWGEVWMGTTEPMQNVDYNGDVGAEQMMVVHHTWNCGTVTTYSGLATATGCGGTDPGKFTITTAATYYIVYKTGGNTIGDPIVIDNVTLVTANPSPEASFTAATSTSNLDAVFTNTSMHATDYTWDFGDGSGSTQENPTHTYAAAGPYTVTLLAEGAGGTNEYSSSIVVGNPTNFITNGTFDDATGWTVINHYEATNTLGDVSISGDVATWTETEAGPWKHMGIYTSVYLDPGTYQFDFQVTFDGIWQIWGEVYMGTTEPIQNGGDYNGDFQVLNAFNGWGGPWTYSGLATGTGVDASPTPGQFDITTAGTYYLCLRVGGNSYGPTGIVIDDMTLYEKVTLSDVDHTIEGFGVYPNPATDKVYFKNINGTKNIRIFDVNGRVISKQVIESNELSIESLSNGLYFLEINGQVKKLLKK